MTIKKLLEILKNTDCDIDVVSPCFNNVKIEDVNDVCLVRVSFKNGSGMVAFYLRN